MSDIKHSTTVVIADDGVSAVGSDEWNATHNQSVPDGSTVTGDVDRYSLTSSQRVTINGTGRLAVEEAELPFRGSYGLGSFQLIDGTWLLQYKRASLAGNARASLSGTSDLFIFDLAPVNRLVLAGGPS